MKEFETYRAERIEQWKQQKKRRLELRKSEYWGCRLFKLMKFFFFSKYYEIIFH